MGRDKKTLFFLWLGVLLFGVALVLAGCGAPPPPKKEKAAQPEQGAKPSAEAAREQAPPPAGVVVERTKPPTESPGTQASPPTESAGSQASPPAEARQAAEARRAAEARPAAEAAREAKLRPKIVIPPAAVDKSVSRYPAALGGKKKSIDMIPAQRSANFLTGKQFLCRDQQEDKDYGLQSYIVIVASPADDLERQRLKALYQSYYQTFRPTGDLVDRSVKKEDINGTYWPLRLKASEVRSLPGGDDARAIDLYDYSRAQLWLHYLELQADKGPYIISSFVPLETLDKKNGVPQMLILDLTKIHRDQFADVMVFFRCKVCDRPDTWNNYNWDVEWIKTTGLSALHAQAQSAIKFWEWINGKVKVSSAYAAASP